MYYCNFLKSAGSLILSLFMFTVLIAGHVACGEGYIPGEDAGNPGSQNVTHKRLFHVSATSNGPRVDVSCPEGFALLGGGCACEPAPTGWQPAPAASVQVGLPDGRINTQVCDCEVRQVNGQLPETTRQSFVTAQCLELGGGPDIVEEVLPTEHHPDICWPPYGNGDLGCGRP